MRTGAHHRQHMLTTRPPLAVSSRVRLAGDVTPLSELWEPYKPNRYYYELVEFARRVLLTGAGVFIYPNSASQIAIILLLALAFGILFEVLAPYKKPFETWLYRVGYVVVILSMYLALLLRVDISDDGSWSQDMFSGVLVLVHCLMIMAVFAEGIHVIIEGRGGLRSTEG